MILSLRTRAFCASAIVAALALRDRRPSRACRRPTASSGTSRTPRPGRRTAAASRPAAAPTRSTASAISSSACAPPAARCSCRNQYLTRLRPRARRRRAASIRSRRCCTATSSSRARCSRRRTRTTCATSTASPTPRPSDRAVDVAWGGAAGAFEDGGPVTVAATSDGDRTIDPADTFVTVMQNAQRVADPMRGPSGHGPSAHVLGSHAPGLLTAVGDMYADPFTEPWPGYDPAHIGYVFTLTVKPGQTAVADDLRRQGTERGLRSARRLPDPAARRAGRRRSTRRRTPGRAEDSRRRDPRSRA